MKYEIEMLVASVTADNKDDIRKILNGDIYDVISYSEGGELMDEKEAREEFAKLSASACWLEDGSIEARIPVLIRGEEALEEDVLLAKMEQAEMVIADPLFRYGRKGNAVFIPFPHEGYSGRIFRKDIPVFTGDGFDIERYIREKR